MSSANLRGGAPESKSAEAYLAVLSQLGLDLSTARTPADAGRVIADMTEKLFGWDAFTLSSYSPERDEIQPVFEVDTFEGQKAEVAPLPLKTRTPSVTWRVLNLGAELILKDNTGQAASNSVPFGNTSRLSASLMFVPIRDNARNIGVLSIQSYKPNAYEQRDMDLLQGLADYCGGALERIRVETALRESEAARRESDQRFASFMQHLPGHTWMKDSEGRYIYANDTVLETLGKTMEEICGQTGEDLFPPEVANAFRGNDQIVISTGKGLQAVETAPGPEGTIYYLVNKFPIQGKEGEPPMVGGIGLDITERKRAEEALALSNERLSLIAQVTNAVVGAAELQDQMRTVAETVRKAYDVDACVIRTLDGGDMVLLASAGLPEEHRHARLPVAGTLAEDVVVRRGPLFVPEVLMHPAGAKVGGTFPNTYPFYFYAGAPLLAQDQIVGVLALFAQKKIKNFTRADLDHLQIIGNQIAVAITNDRLYHEVSRQKEQLQKEVAERRQAEEEIQRLNADLERRVQDRTAQLVAVNQEMEAFCYSVSHDLRAPLRGILGFAQIVKEDNEEKLGEESREHLLRVIRASRHMDELIDSLLHLSRLTRGEVKRGTVNLSSVAQAIVLGLRNADPDRNVEFELQPIPPVRGDGRLLRIALENLFSNAWKFTGKRSNARVEFGMEKTGPDETAYFIRDNGAGFDMTYANKLFTPFQRLHSASEFPGHGIGLATVQRIISRHGGRIWASGEVDRGATFYFTVPE